MASLWLPLQDGMLLQFAGGFMGTLGCDPVSFGVSAGDVLALENLAAAYSAALQAAQTPGTRTSVSLEEKKQAKGALVAKLREVVKRIKANANVSEPQRAALGIVECPRRAHVHPLETAPTLNLESMSVRAHQILIRHLTSSGWSKPRGADGVEIYVYVSPKLSASTSTAYNPAPSSHPPTHHFPPVEADQTMHAWEFRGLTSRRRFQLTYNSTDSGKTAIIVARWYNKRGERSPLSEPLYVPIAA